MTTTVPVEREAAVFPGTTPGRPLPARVTEAIAAAGFPPEAGDPAQLFRYASLDAQSPTVSHLLKNGNISPFQNLGMAVQRLTLAMNRVETPSWGMRTISGEFLFVDPERLAALPAPVRESVRAALGRMTRGLGGETSGPIDGNVDTVERRSATPTDRGPPRAATTPPQPATRRDTGTPLPEHPALDGISNGYRAWLTRGEHRMETVEALLGERPESFEAGLTAVQQRYGLGTPGRPANLEAAAQAVQTEAGVPGRPDGKFGRVSTPYLRNARERYGEQMATPAGRNTVREQLASKPNLLAAISEQVGADRQAAEPLEAAPAPVSEPLPTVNEPALPLPQPVANPFADLAKLRETDPAAYTERRSRIIDGARNDPRGMATLFRDSFAVNRDLATDLATGWLDGHDVQARRTFATLVGQDNAVAANLPAELNDRLGRTLAPIAPSQGLFSPPTGAALAALQRYEGNRVARATSLDQMFGDDRDRYATFMWASPAAVAAAVTRLSTGHPEVADQFGASLATHLQSGGPIATLDARVDAAYALFQPLQGDVRAQVDQGIRGMGHIRGFNIWGIEDRLTDRVTRPRG